MMKLSTLHPLLTLSHHRMSSSTQQPSFQYLSRMSIKAMLYDVDGQRNLSKLFQSLELAHENDQVKINFSFRNIFSNQIKKYHRHTSVLFAQEEKKEEKKHPFPH